MWCNRNQPQTIIMRRYIIIIAAILFVIAAAIIIVILCDKASAYRHFTKCKSQFNCYTIEKTVSDTSERYLCRVKLSQEEWDKLQQELLKDGWWKENMATESKEGFINDLSNLLSHEEVISMSQIWRSDDDQHFILIGKYYRKEVFVVPCNEGVLLGVRLTMLSGGIH